MLRSQSRLERSRSTSLDNLAAASAGRLGSVAAETSTNCSPLAFSSSSACGSPCSSPAVRSSQRVATYRPACSTDARRMRPRSSGDARKWRRSRGSSTRSMVAFSFGSAPELADHTSTCERFSSRISTSASWRSAPSAVACSKLSKVSTCLEPSGSAMAAVQLYISRILLSL